MLVEQLNRYMRLVHNTGNKARTAKRRHDGAVLRFWIACDDRLGAISDERLARFYKTNCHKVRWVRRNMGIETSDQEANE